MSTLGLHFIQKSHISIGKALARIRHPALFHAEKHPAIGFFGLSINTM